MIKNCFLLALLMWVTTSYAKVVQDNLADAEAYKVEKPTPEQEATRGVAGAKIKKKRMMEKTESPKEIPTESPDSEVRFWKYSEE